MDIHFTNGLQETSIAQCSGLNFFKSQLAGELGHFDFDFDFGIATKTYLTIVAAPSGPYGRLLFGVRN